MIRIALEGLPRAGKTTTIQKLVPLIEARGLSVQIVDTKTLETTAPLREKIKTLSPESEEYIHTQWEIRKLQGEALNTTEADIVLIDRYIDSTFATDVYGHGIPQETVTTALGDIPKPDLSILLTISNMERTKRGTGRTMHDESFAARVEDGFHKLASQPNHAIVSVDGKTEDEVAQECLSLILKKR